VYGAAHLGFHERQFLCPAITARLCCPASELSHFNIWPGWKNLASIHAARRHLHLLLHGRTLGDLMSNNPKYDREALRRLFAEARVQRSRELRAAARQILSGVVHGNGVALGCVALVAVVSVAACAAQ
jgi:hypothetical protein